MSKLKAAYALTKAVGKAYKIGFKTSKAQRLSKQAGAFKNLGKAHLYKSQQAYKSATQGFGGTTAMKAAKQHLSAAKLFGNTARVKAFDAKKLTRAAKRTDAKGGLIAVARKAGTATPKVLNIAAGYATGKYIGNKLKGHQPLTFRQKAALKKAQLASALKRKLA